MLCVLQRCSHWLQVAAEDCDFIFILMLQYLRFIFQQTSTGMASPCVFSLSHTNLCIMCIVSTTRSGRLWVPEREQEQEHYTNINNSVTFLIHQNSRQVIIRLFLFFKTTYVMKISYYFVLLTVSCK